MTLHEIGLALQAYLTKNKCPLVVVDGPEPAQTVVTYGAERVVLEHDIDGTDSFANPRGIHSNAKHRFTATDAFKASIYVRSNDAGARPFEHRTRAKNAREVVMAGLELVLATNRNKFKPTTGRFFVPKDMAESEQPNGAAYELKFTCALPIRVVTFVGAARPEGTLTAVTSKTQVSRPDTPDDDDNPNTPPAAAETACGA